MARGGRLGRADKTRTEGTERQARGPLGKGTKGMNEKEGRTKRGTATGGGEELAGRLESRKAEEEARKAGTF